MSYAEQLRPPTTLTDREVDKLLKTMGQHKAGLRDRLIVSYGLGCALRESEIVALNVGNVSSDGVEPKRIIQLDVYKRAGNGDGLNPKFQRVHVPDDTYYLTKRYLKVMWSDHDISRSLDRPLFPTRQSERLGGRQVRRMFREWQRRAGFDQLYNFHILRHTSITHIVRDTGDVARARMQARHVSVYTTIRYTHPSDEEVAKAVKGLTA